MLRVRIRLVLDPNTDSQTGEVSKYVYFERTKLVPQNLGNFNLTSQVLFQLACAVFVNRAVIGLIDSLCCCRSTNWQSSRHEVSNRQRAEQTSVRQANDTKVIGLVESREYRSLAEMHLLITWPS